MLFPRLLAEIVDRAFHCQINDIVRRQRLENLGGDFGLPFLQHIHRAEMACHQIQRPCKAGIPNHHSCKPKNPQPSGSETPIVSGEPTSSASQTENADASSTPDATPSETLPDTKTEFEKVGIPNVNYQEATIYVFHWDAGYPEYEVNRLENDGDPILDAIYKRNLYTEQLLNVELDFTEELGNGNKQKEFAETCRRSLT